MRNDQRIRIKHKGGTGFNGSRQPLTAVAWITPSMLDFGVVPIGQSKDLILTVRGSDTGSLVLKFDASPLKEFSYTTSVLSVGSGQTLTIPIHFAPTKSGAYTAKITFTSNDPSRLTGSILVTGRTSNN